MGTAQELASLSPIATTAPSPAPPESPSRYGSASGLRTSAWRAAPQTPRLPPTRKARNTRGSLRLRMISALGADGSTTPRHNATGVSGTAPASIPASRQPAAISTASTPRFTAATL
jgi:hypothetical protein